MTPRRKNIIYLCETVPEEEGYSVEEQWAMYDALVKEAGVEPAGQDVIELWRIIREKEAAHEEQRLLE